MARETRPVTRDNPSRSVLPPTAGGIGKQALTQGLAGGQGAGVRVAERDQLIQRVIDNADDNPRYAKQQLGQLRERFADDREAIEFADRADAMFAAEQEEEEQEASAELAELAVEAASEQRESSGGETPAPQQQPARKPAQRLRLLIPFPADVQELIGQVRAGKQSMLVLRDRLVKLLIQISVPTDAANAARIAELFQTRIIESDAELLSGLSRKVAGKRSYQTAARQSFTFTDEMLRDWRSAAGVREAKAPAATPTPSLTGGNEQSVTDAVWWIWDLLKGDFNENPTAMQTVLNGVFGLIPGIDQVLDGRDVIANLYALIGQRRYDELDPWFNFVVTLIGAVPEVGSVIKTILKLAKRGAKVPLDEVIGIAKAIDLGDHLAILQRTLDKLVGGIAGVSGAVLARGQQVLRGAIGQLEWLHGKATSISSLVAARVNGLLEAARASLARAADKIRQVMDLVVAKCRELRDAVAERIAKLTKQDDLSITPKPDAPVVKQTPSKAPAKSPAKSRTPAAKPDADRDAAKLDPDQTPDQTPDQKPDATKALSEERQRIRDNFLRKFPNNKATVYRGVRLSPGEAFVGAPGKQQMVTTIGEESAALDYALMSPNRTKPKTERDRIFVMKMEITWEHIVHDPYDAIEHVFLDPMLDITKLPGFKLTELTVEQAKAPDALQRITAALR